jgi:hypothetical protein
MCDQKLLPVMLASQAQVDAAAQAMTDELAGCLTVAGGLSCKLVQDMTSSTGTFAEQRVPVLQELPKDPQRHSIKTKNNIERFTWEFLANRTFTGEPHDTVDKDGQAIGCDPDTNKCPASEVCCTCLCMGIGISDVSAWLCPTFCALS